MERNEETMDFGFNVTRRPRQGSYASVTGVIQELIPAMAGNGSNDACTIYASLEDESGNPVTFVITPATFVVDYETLSVGMNCTFWYRTDAPAPLIYPPQYYAAVAAVERDNRSVDVSYYNQALVNEENTLQLNLDGRVDVRTTNNQYFQGNPANHNLVVLYDFSTRSIPAQTTPQKIIVLCQ